MKTVTFYGSSDDLVEIDGIKGADEFNVYEQINAFEVITGVIGEETGLRVLAIYDNDGTWSFAVALLGEGIELPDWEMELLSPNQHEMNNYSTMLSIEVPDDARVRYVK